MKHFLFSLFSFFVLTASILPSTAFAVNGCLTTKGGACTQVQTAFGPINTDVASLVGDVLRVLIGISGGVAVLLVIAAGYQLITSQGNPEKVKEARERLTSAIVGLLFIFFSVTILQIIGIQLLQLPGLSSK